MIQSETLRNVINFVLFQAGWLICILYTGVMAAGVVAVFLVIHFALISQNR